MKNISLEDMPIIKQLTDKELDIYYYEFIQDARIRKLQGADLPSYAICFPSFHKDTPKDIWVYETDIIVMKKIGLKTSTESMLLNIAKVVLDPKNEKYFSYKPLAMYVSGKEWLIHTKDIKNNFSPDKIREYRERS